MTAAEDNQHRCPRCGNLSTDFLQIEAGMRLALQTTEEAGALPDHVCAVCYNELTGKVSKGVKLRLEEQAKAKNKAMMWKSRVNLVKHARQLMQVKSFPEAAASYEKYIRVLEIAHDLDKGQLTPDVFNKSTRSKELTVVATAYWDLIRIYDTSPSYRDRMQTASKKLADFAPYSPIYPDIVRKAEQFVRQAKNPDLIRSFLRQSRRNRPRCFIATAAFYPAAPEVQFLRRVRDEKLKSRYLGRKFVWLYYRVSPRLARLIEKNPRLRAITRFFLRLIFRFFS